MGRFYLKLIVGFSLLCLLPAHAEGQVRLPEDYTRIVQEYFADEQWAEGKRTLDEGIEKYPNATDLQWLMGKYWHHEKDYDRARYHLVKSIEADYNNVNAKYLLVDVEEQTEHYSSAICYVNELLEVNPYWRGLWRRKIDLYRKQGNEEEAQRLLRRINQIYPNDSILQRDYLYTTELNYIQQKRDGNRQEAIETLNELIRKSPNNEEYYLDLINLYLQEGDAEQALVCATSGLMMLPGSTALVTKKASILAELGRYPEALAFMRDRLNRTPNAGQMGPLYNNLLLEAARAERQRDPYILYGMVYETTRDREALDFLLNTSITRGYNDDALYYLKEAKGVYGDTDRSLLYKEYMILRNMGESTRAYGVLQRMYELYPGDFDITMAMCTQQMERAGRFMSDGDYAGALPFLQFVIDRDPDDETTKTAMERMMGCYINMHRYADALVILDKLSNRYPEYVNPIGKRADLLDKLGRTPEALDIFRAAVESAPDSTSRAFYVMGYEELAVPYIKRLIEVGATQQAYAASIELLRLNPASDLGLHYAINTSSILGRTADYRRFTEQGYAYYPDDPFYKIKRASVFEMDQDYPSAIALMLPEARRYPDNAEIVGALSQSSEFYALDLIRANETQPALAVLDTALVFDSRNPSLLYTKGLAFEKEKIYDSAYYYQKYYEPSDADRNSFNRHLMGLQNAGFKNEVGLTYLQARYAEEDVITSIASVEYNRKEKDDIYTGRVNYAGRDGTSQSDLNEGEEFSSGGVGVQLQAEWTHKFNKQWQGMANLAWGSKYFPKLMINGVATYFMKNDIELEGRIGYRLLADDRSLFSIGPGISKTWGPWWASGKLDLLVIESKFHFNLSAEGRYFPLTDGRTYITAMAGIGSAPEMDILDYGLTNSFSKLNTMVGLGGRYLLTQNITLGLLGTWHTYYNQVYMKTGEVDNNYRNLYNIYAQVFIAF